MKKVWKEPLDHKGNSTYSINFGDEMTALGHTLSNVVCTLSTVATAAGLSKASEQISGNIYKVKFSIPLVSKQVFTEKGKPLDMEIVYTSSGGEVDSFTAVVHIKDK